MTGREENFWVLLQTPQLRAPNVKRVNDVQILTGNLPRFLEKIPLKVYRNLSR